MEMRAYPSDYLTSAQRILGDMLDFAVNTCDLDIDLYFWAFHGIFCIRAISKRKSNLYCWKNRL